jgi:hypothetical protein
MYCFACSLFASPVHPRSCQARVNIVQYPDSYTGELYSYYTDESAQVIGIIPELIGLKYISEWYYFSTKLVDKIRLELSKILA